MLILVFYRLVHPSSVTSGARGPTDPRPGKGKKEKRAKGYRDGSKHKAAAMIRGETNEFTK